VRSCWGGMIAYDARFFQEQPHRAIVPPTAASESPANITAPYRFRAESDMFWDASECCLIQADIQSPDPDHTGVYMNPYVRVAYGMKTLSWLWFTKRFERLYTPIHFMVDILVSMPQFNPRRDEIPWQRVEETVWVPDSASPAGGAFESVSRLASHSGFCGRRNLPVMKPTFTNGEKNYEHIPIPS
jgi:Cryptococcal mannosyltransferase 1